MQALPGSVLSFVVVVIFIYSRISKRRIAFPEGSYYEKK